MIFIYGADGMLGTYVCNLLDREGWSVKGITRKNWEYPAQLPGDSIIVNCAGLIPQRKPDLTEMVRINTLFPLELCKWHDKVINISTDCVKDGTPYGMTKSLGECGTVIRTSFIGEEKRNKLSLLEWCKSKKGQTVEGYTNHFWSGVTALSLARVIVNYIDRDNFTREVRELRSESPPISKYELIKLISKVYDLDLTVTPKKVKHVNRVLNGNIYPASIEDQLYELKEFKYGQ